MDWAQQWISIRVTMIYMVTYDIPLFFIHKFVVHPELIQLSPNVTPFHLECVAGAQRILLRCENECPR